MSNVTKNQKVLSQRNLRVVLDKDQVFPADPDAGTPAMVYWDSTAIGQFWGSYWRVCGEGEVENTRGETHRLTSYQMEWLERIGPEVEEFLRG